MKKVEKGRVKDWLPITIRNRLSVSAPFVWRCLNNHSIVDFTNPSSSNRACGATAHGFPMFFTPRLRLFPASRCRNLIKPIFRIKLSTRKAAKTNPTIFNLVPLHQMYPQTLFSMRSHFPKHTAGITIVEVICPSTKIRVKSVY